jgi:bacterioferritin-associated ferredoxin
MPTNAAQAAQDHVIFEHRLSHLTPVNGPEVNSTATRIHGAGLIYKRQNGLDRPEWWVMDQDAKVCYCFHVSRRKLVNFVRLNHPRVASQLSECGGAGTGCGWCIPFLKQIFEAGVDGVPTDLDRLSADEYEKRRATYVRAGKGTPPPGATPLPDDESTQ